VRCWFLPQLDVDAGLGSKRLDRVSRSQPLTAPPAYHKLCTCLCLRPVPIITSSTNPPRLGSRKVQLGLDQVSYDVANGMSDPGVLKATKSETIRSGDFIAPECALGCVCGDERFLYLYCCFPSARHSINIGVHAIALSAQSTHKGPYCFFVAAHGPSMVSNYRAIYNLV
jgi:hypothetical protein